MANEAGKEAPDASTPHQERALAEAFKEDREALRKAEEDVRSLAPGVIRYRCPDEACTAFWDGPPGSPAEKAYKAHLERHQHARDALRMRRAG